MKHVITLLYSLFTLTHIFATPGIDFSKRPTYGKPESLAESEEILSEIRFFAQKYPALLKETGKTFDISLQCKSLSISLASNEAYFKGRELGDIHADITATVYEFEITGYSSEIETNANHFQVSMGSTEANTSTTKRTMDTASLTTITTIPRAMNATMATCVYYLQGLVASVDNNLIPGATELPKNRLYVVVYSQVQYCDPGISSFFAPVIITSGITKPEKDTDYPHLIYIPIFKDSSERASFRTHTLKWLYHQHNGTGRIVKRAYWSTKYDHLDIAINDAGAKDGDRATITINEEVIAEDYDFEHKRGVIRIPLEVGRNKMFITAVSTGTMPMCHFVVNVETIKFSSAYDLEKDDEVEVTIEREPE